MTWPLVAHEAIHYAFVGFCLQQSVGLIIGLRATKGHTK
jgi:hypothetical protein